MKSKKTLRKALAMVLACIFAIGMPTQNVSAAEGLYAETDTLEVVVNNMKGDYIVNAVQPLTLLVDCEIIMAFTPDGLEMEFTTSSAGVASVIGVKDIKVQQKVWYGWKTVFTSDGTESYDRALFAAELTYPDAIKDKTYRVICTHYADYDGYEEVENDTGAFKFTY